MPRMKLFVKIYEDDDKVSTTEDVEFDFESYDIVDAVTDYLVDLLFRRAVRDDPY